MSFSSVLATLFPVAVGVLAQWRPLRPQDYFDSAEFPRVETMVRNLSVAEGVLYALVLYLMLIGNVALLGWVQASLFAWSRAADRTLPFVSSISAFHLFPYLTGGLTALAAMAFELSLLLRLCRREFVRKLLLTRVGHRAGYINVLRYPREAWAAVAVAVLINIYGDTRLLRITATDVAYRGWTDVALVRRSAEEVDSVVYKRAFRNSRGEQADPHIIISFRDGAIYDTRGQVSEEHLPQLWRVLAGLANYRDKVFRAQ